MECYIIYIYNNEGTKVFENFVTEVYKEPDDAVLDKIWDDLKKVLIEQEIDYKGKDITYTEEGRSLSFRSNDDSLLWTDNYELRFCKNENPLYFDHKFFS